MQATRPIQLSPKRKVLSNVLVQQEVKNREGLTNQVNVEGFCGFVFFTFS